MKKNFEYLKSFIIFGILTILALNNSVFAENIDKYSKEYLQSKKHFSILRPVAENIVEKNIKQALKKETGSNFDVKFSGYSVSSMKEGIFKSLELTGKDFVSYDIPITYLHLKSLDDYNYIDYKQNPIVFKSDMTFSYDMLLSEDSVNKALEGKDYQNVIKNVNKIAYPLFVTKNVRTKILENHMYLIMTYNIPLIKSSKEKTFVMTTDFTVENGKIKAKNVHIDSSYGNIGLNKVANLINLLNPLDFTLKLIDTKKCNGIIENVNIIDNKIKIDGKIFIKGEG